MAGIAVALSCPNERLRGEGGGRSRVLTRVLGLGREAGGEVRGPWCSRRSVLGLEAGPAGRSGSG